MTSVEFTIIKILSTMKKNLIFKIAFCIGLLSSTISNGQNEALKWNIGLHGGLTQYNGDRGMNFYAFNQAAYGFGGLSISRYLGPHVDFSLFGTRGELGNTQQISDWTTANDLANRHFLVRMTTASAMFRYNITGPQYGVRPYLFAGAGVIVYDKRYSESNLDLNQRTDFAIPSFGAGINFRLTDVIGFQIQETFMYTTNDAIDHTVRNYNDGYLFHSAGLTFNLGKKQDADIDGVSDKKDACPLTPAGVMVDDKGCPVDRDKDGVADYLDNCPDEFGLATLGGCADKDMDGVANKDDRCPDVAGAIGLNGCPDTDKDGIADIDDNCSGTKSGYKVDVKGCPLDNDKYGIVNEEDRCPDAAGVSGLKGCPDADADGIADMDDHCPNAKGDVAHSGCPEIPKADIQKITVIAGKIFFETGSDKLKLESDASLDELVVLMNKYPALHLTIEGHTDNVGEDAYNMTLSQKRTESVKAYLISKGISESRLKAIGFGETSPVADNKTAAGRAKNRRVELKTSY